MCEIKNSNRWFVRCKDCLTVAAIDAVWHTTWQAYEGLQKHVCGICNGKIEAMGKVQQERLANTENRWPCDNRCTSAIGPNCDCSCGGKNHGSNMIVEVTVDAGGIPKLNNWKSAMQGSQALAQAENYRAALLLAKTLKDKFAELRKQRNLNNQEWLKFDKLNAAIVNLEKSRTPKSRIERISRIIEICS